MKWMLVITILILAVVPDHARADTSLIYGELTCEGNRALVRFARAFNTDEPRFPDVPDGIELPKVRRIDGNRCQLADGREVLVKIGLTQARPFGMCGGATNGFASLWVGGRKVLSRMPVVEACFADTLNDIVMLDDDRLTRCRTAAAVYHLIRSTLVVGCDDASDMLDAALLDVEEYPSDPSSRPTWGTLNILQAENREFCESFIVPVTPTAQTADLHLGTDAYHSPASMRSTTEFGPRVEGWRLRPPEALREPQPLTDEFLPLGRKSGFESGPVPVSMASVDFDNDGQTDIVIRYEGKSGHSYSRVFYVSGPGDHPGLQREIEALIADPDASMLALLRAQVEGKSSFVYTGWHNRFSPHYSPRHTFNTMLQADGQTLIYARPAFSRLRPTAIIYRPQPMGQAELVCAFQRVEENF